MTKETMKQALEALELAENGIVYSKLVDGDKLDAAITSLRQAIEQAEKQEPVAWVCNHYEEGVKNDVDYWQDEIDALPVGMPLYTTPQPQREWVGLTDEERTRCLFEYITDEARAKAIEAKLKEKNGG